MKRLTTNRPPIVWEEIFFSEMISPSGAATAFEHLCSNGMLGSVVIELRATTAGIRWLVGAPETKVSSITGLLSTHLDVHQTEAGPREDVAFAGKIKITSGTLSTQPERVVAAIRGLYGTLSRLDTGEQLTLQLLVGRRILPPVHARPISPSWLELLAGAVFGPPTTRTRELSAQTAQYRASADLHGAHANLRVGIAGAGDARARYLGNQVLGALRVLETTESRIRLEREAPVHLNRVSLPRRWPLRLRSYDLVGLSGWPVGEPPMPVVGNLHPRMLPPPLLGRMERIFAKAAAPGHTQMIGIPIRDAAFHTHLLGPTGSGKSSVMLNLIMEDINAGRGVLVIDPKGDLATDVLSRVPIKRHGDVVVLDPSSTSPVGFNPLAGPKRLEHVTADTLLSTFEALFHENWGIRTADVLSAALLTLARIPDANLLWLPPLLTNPAFRKEALKGSNDPLGVDSFWEQYDAKKPDRQAQEIAPVLNKLRQLILRPTLRAMLGQPKPKFDLEDLFSRKKIVVLSLNKGLLGAEAARLLGSLLVGQLWARILARQSDPPERRHIVGIYIDEVHDFISGIPGDLADALAQARSLGAAFTLANQYRSQLTPAMQAAIDSNTRSKIVFGLNGADASYLAKTTSKLEAADFQLLPKYHAYVNLMHQGQATDWFAVSTLPPSRPLQDPSVVYLHSHERYGVSASETEATLVELTRLRLPETPDAPVGRARTARSSAADTPAQTDTVTEAPPKPGSGPEPGKRSETPKSKVGRIRTAPVQPAADEEDIS